VTGIVHPFRAALTLHCGLRTFQAFDIGNVIITAAKNRLTVAALEIEWERWISGDC